MLYIYDLSSFWPALVFYEIDKNKLKDYKIAGDWLEELK